MIAVEALMVLYVISIATQIVLCFIVIALIGRVTLLRQRLEHQQVITDRMMATQENTISVVSSLVKAVTSLNESNRRYQAIAKGIVSISPPKSPSDSDGEA